MGWHFLRALIVQGARREGKVAQGTHVLVQWGHWSIIHQLSHLMAVHKLSGGCAEWRIATCPYSAVSRREVCCCATQLGKEIDMELEGRRIAILVEDNYNELELWYPLLRMREAGARADVVGMAGAAVYHSEHGYPVGVDLTADEVSPQGFDAVIVPGGFAPDLMRRHQPMLDLVREVFEGGGVVAFICRGAWVPISAGILEGRRATSLPSIQADVSNAGGLWEDREVVRDRRLISSREPRDLPAFCRAIISALAESAAADE